MKSNPAEQRVFNTRTTIRCKNTLIDLSKPVVMGILNLTPDSFFDGGKYTENKAIIRHAGRLLKDGAAIIDLGAASSRPGSKAISEKTELKRLIPALKGILDRHPEAIISVDTWRSEVAERCIQEGASIINDISAGNLDLNMFKTVARLGVPYIMMHMQGTPQTMQIKPEYKDVVTEVFRDFNQKLSVLRKNGATDILIDPGFGFGKTLEQNYRLLNALPEFSLLGYPILVGISRKSMICKALNVTPEKALNGTTALHMAALMKGAAVLRVHDVKEATETIRLFNQIKHQGTIGVHVEVSP
jgi:dihydropteroate synthase